MSLDVYLHSNKCQHCGRSDEAFYANITHNLGKMASAAGIYGVVWRPEENGITTARQLVKPLRKAIIKMKADPEKFKKYDSLYGYGLYKNFLSWLERYLKACETYPDANVTASR